MFVKAWLSIFKQLISVMPCLSLNLLKYAQYIGEEDAKVRQ